MTREELVRVIIRESEDLARGVDAAQAAATILWAASSLLDQLDPYGDMSARIVTRNGYLVDRYARGE